MTHRTPLLIVGAGPFGLAMSAWARHLGVEHVMLGRAMDFWEENMPRGMLLRSACDWHLDPAEEHTIERYLKENGRTPDAVEPLSLDFYLGYARWFQQAKEIESVPRFVERLDLDGPTGGYRAHLEDGGTIEARNVLLAPGFRHFAHVPPELAQILPRGRYEHTCERVDLAPLRGKRVLIVGGRQSAFEWAALLREAGAAWVHVVHRHPTPRFEASDWTWVDPLIVRMGEEPGWFRNLTEEDREAMDRRFWEEGRLKLEPWLGPRVHADRVSLWPERSVVACEPAAGGGLKVGLDGAEELTVDHVILATGYRVAIERLPYLAAGDVLSHIETDGGAPLLDERLQTTSPGLFITSMPATRDFGAFFAFTVSVRVSAKIVGRAITDTRCTHRGARAV
ncbi:MAG TPA: FAD-dependent oxidoreductase [Gemmatimonadota bacterium]|nr:FAD-dependent oxidoreductase [Gemmatimonadota bacterium]